MKKETKLDLEVEKIGVPLIDALSNDDKKTFAWEILLLAKEYYKEQNIDSEQKNIEKVESININRC